MTTLAAVLTTAGLLGVGGTAQGQAVQSIRNSVKAGMTLTSHEPFTHQGHRGLRLFIAMPSLNQVMRMDCILVGQRLYRVWFIARTTADLDTAPVRAFFGSLKIL